MSNLLSRREAVKTAAASIAPLIAACHRLSAAQRARPNILIGAISLKKGRGKLALLAIEIAGKEVADLRYIALTGRG